MDKNNLVGKAKAAHTSKIKQETISQVFNHLQEEGLHWVKITWEDKCRHLEHFPLPSPSPQL